MPFQKFGWNEVYSACCILYQYKSKQLCIQTGVDFNDTMHTEDILFGKKIYNYWWLKRNVLIHTEQFCSPVGRFQFTNTEPL